MKAFMNFLANLKAQKEGFRFGEAWRLTKQHTGALVPIIRERVFDREYIIFEELKAHDYAIEDTGSIDKVLFRNMSSEDVFIRTGTIFKGIGTQTRSVQSSFVVGANSKIEIPVRCVHASHHISKGSSFVGGGYTPAGVTIALCSAGGQSVVWDRVKSETTSSSFVGYSSASFSRTADDLYSYVETQKASKEIKDFIKEMPLVENQIGVVVLDENGVYAIELFDHPMSWREFRESVALTYSAVLNKKTNERIFDVVFKEDLILPAIQTFALRMETGESKKANQSTNMLKSETVAGEYTEHYNKIIHVLGFRRDSNEADNSL